MSTVQSLLSADEVDGEGYPNVGKVLEKSHLIKEGGDEAEKQVKKELEVWQRKAERDIAYTKSQSYMLSLYQQNIVSEDMKLTDVSSGRIVLLLPHFRGPKQVGTTTKRHTDVIPRRAKASVGQLLNVISGLNRYLVVYHTCTVSKWQKPDNYPQRLVYSILGQLCTGIIPESQSYNREKEYKSFSTPDCSKKGPIWMFPDLQSHFTLPTMRKEFERLLKLHVSEGRIPFIIIDDVASIEVSEMARAVFYALFRAGEDIISQGYGFKLLIPSDEAVPWLESLFLKRKGILRKKPEEFVDLQLLRDLDEDPTNLPMVLL